MGTYFWRETYLGVQLNNQARREAYTCYKGGY